MSKSSKTAPCVSLRWVHPASSPRPRRITDQRLATIWRHVSAQSVRGTVVLCDDARIAALNARYRGKRGPTDVLTFVYNLVRGSRFEVRNSTSNIEHRTSNISGEIYIALGVARRQARARRVTVHEERLRLCVHGLAHLAGYDHHTRPEFMAMRKKEFEALVQIL